MSKKIDGRRNNQPPEHGKIKPREVRNPHGRGGKPRETAPNLVDRIYLEEASGLLRTSDGEYVTRLRRLIQEEFADGLLNGDVEARLRLLREISRSADQVEQQQDAILINAINYKVEWGNAFYRSQKCRSTPPDALPHPAHNQITPDGVKILGPTTQQQREWWETRKGCIQVIDKLHAYARQAYRANPSEVTKRSLAEVEARRRKLMRGVPKGWNWKEKIWTRGRDPYFDETIANLKELDDDFDQAED